MFWFTWQTRGGGAGPGGRDQELPPAPKWTHGRSESIQETGGAYVKTHVRTGHKLPNSRESEAQAAEINPWV